MHNFTKVIAFEVRRTLTRPAFWVATLAVPLFIGVLSGLMTLSTSQVASGSGGGTATRFTYADASGLVSPSIAACSGRGLLDVTIHVFDAPPFCLPASTVANVANVVMSVAAT